MSNALFRSRTNQGNGKINDCQAGEREREREASRTQLPPSFSLALSTAGSKSKRERESGRERARFSLLQIESGLIQLATNSPRLA